MNLTGMDRAWLDKRKALLRLWPVIGGAIIVGLFGFALWLWLTVPLMINPWATLAAIEADAVDETTLTVMALLLPILMLACLGVILTTIVLLFAAFSRERRLIALVDKLEGEGDRAGSAAQ